MRRRGKGEASFLHFKSLGREEPDLMNIGRGMKGEKEAKPKQTGREKEGKRRKLKLGKRKRGQKWGTEKKQGNKGCWMRVKGGATLGISCSFNTWVISSNSLSNVGQRRSALHNS